MFLDSGESDSVLLLHIFSHYIGSKRDLGTQGRFPLPNNIKYYLLSI